MPARLNPESTLEVFGQPLFSRLFFVERLFTGLASPTSTPPDSTSLQYKEFGGRVHARSFRGPERNRVAFPCWPPKSWPPAQSKGPPAFLPTGLTLRLTTLALGLTATTFLIELLDRERLGGNGRADDASDERECDKSGYDGFHGHSPKLTTRTAPMPSTIADRSFRPLVFITQCCAAQRAVQAPGNSSRASMRQLHTWEPAVVTMVVIRCPETDREIPTGIVTDLVRFFRLEGYAILQCPHCHQRHRWSRRDAFMSISFRPSTHRNPEQ